MAGAVRLLFKHKGELTDQRNYRSVCLQDTACKILNAILTDCLSIDRLYRLAERSCTHTHGPAGPVARRLPKAACATLRPQRQAQSLHWAFEAAVERQDQIYVIYIDFENVFNSVDHEALWRCYLKLL